VPDLPCIVQCSSEETPLCRQGVEGAPRPVYTVESLLNYIEQCVVELNRDYPSSNIVLADDFNLLPESAVVERTGFDQLVQQPTRGANTLDLVFMSRPMYDVTRVVNSVVKSDHKAVIVCNKRKDIKTYRKKIPNQHASFLEHIATIEFYLSHTDIQAAFDQFYSTALLLCDHFYPERSRTVSSRDPDYITLDLKAKLRRKNKLMRTGRVEEASALAKLIGTEISKNNSVRLQAYQNSGKI